MIVSPGYCRPPTGATVSAAPKIRHKTTGGIPTSQSQGISNVTTLLDGQIMAVGQVAVPVLPPLYALFVTLFNSALFRDTATVVLLETIAWTPL